MNVMTASPENEPEERAATDPAPEEGTATDPTPEERTATEPAPEERPLSRFARRFRIPLGIVVALIGAALAVVFAIRPLDGDTGSRGLITQGAGVALWLCVTGVGVSWALATSRKVTNGFALAGVACYAIFWVSGL